MKLIYPTGKYAQPVKVSNEDFDFLSPMKWHISDRGYAKTYYLGKHVQMHHLIVGKWCDHINGDKLDNRRENLRPATIRQNNANVAPRAKSGFKGVVKDPTCNSYKALISVKGKMVHLGNFQSPQGDERAKHLAALVYDLWAVDLHGEFARTNFPIASGKAAKS